MVAEHSNCLALQTPGLPSPVGQKRGASHPGGGRFLIPTKVQSGLPVALGWLSITQRGPQGGVQGLERPTRQSAAGKRAGL